MQVSSSSRCLTNSSMFFYFPKMLILIEVSWHERQKWDNSLIFLYVLACGSHVVRPNYHLSEPITKQDPPIPEGLAPIQMDRGSVSFKIKPLNLWAMDEGVRGMKLASNMISRVVPLRSFQSQEVKKPTSHPQTEPTVGPIAGSLEVSHCELAPEHSL